MSEFSVSKQLKGLYDDFYDEGDSEWRRLGAIGKAENIVALCKDLPHESVIEIGAGEGSVIARLSQLEFGDRLSALDISKTGVDTIRKKSIPRLTECAVFDGYHVPYPDDRFDLAILSHVVEHVEFPRQLIYEAARVSRYLFIEVPLDDTLRMPWDYVDDGVGHINPHSRRTLRRLVQTCNLRVIAQTTVDRPIETFTYKSGSKGALAYFVRRMFLKLAPRVATSIFTYHGALVCEKEDKFRTV